MSVKSNPFFNFYLLPKRFGRLAVDPLRRAEVGRVAVSEAKLKRSKLFDIDDDEAVVVHGSLKRSAANSSTKKLKK